MACYLDELPKDIRTLLDHYTLRENWEALRTILKVNIWMLRLYDWQLINTRMEQLSLKTYFTTDVNCYGGPIMDPEDLITDAILNIVTHRVIEFIDSGCLMRVVGEINGNLEQTGSRLRLVITLRDGNYRTNIIRGYELLS